jgi:hypothetical protein
MGRRSIMNIVSIAVWKIYIHNSSLNIQPSHEYPNSQPITETMIQIICTVLYRSAAVISKTASPDTPTAQHHRSKRDSHQYSEFYRHRSVSSCLRLVWHNIWIIICAVPPSECTSKKKNNLLLYITPVVAPHPPRPITSTQAVMHSVPSPASQNPNHQATAHPSQSRNPDSATSWHRNSTSS